ncbi:putative Baeyer-Villiger oxidase [Seiridium cardinale]
MPSVSRISMSADHLGHTRGGPAVSAESLEIANQLLQKNHDELHIFFRDMNGHNHLVHNLFTRLALGATPSQLRTAFDDDLPTQRGIPPLDKAMVENLKDDVFFYQCTTKINHYTNFLVFFERQIANKGWQAVVNQYVFSKSRIAEALLPLMYDGAYHSIIHLGLGVEFEQPAVIAEALAQAASHDSFDTDWFFQSAERRAQSESPISPQSSVSSLLDLAREAAACDTIRDAARLPGLIGTMKMKKAIFPKAGEQLLSLASRFRVTEETLEQKTAEMVNFCAYLAGCAQREHRTTKIDFFFMHCVTSSILLSVLAQQSWIDIATRVRLIEWKGRLDLTWYVTCGVPNLDLDYVKQYQVGTERGWDEIFELVSDQHDDGHVAKFVRALKHGEDICKQFEDGDASNAFPIRGDLWQTIARMSYDSTLHLPPPAKWVIMSGMDQAWESVPHK